jgi:alpha-1,3-rhamnosyltransferase
MAQILQQNSTVSVCIPSYNHSQYIEQCLRSIFVQTHAPSELIVIDDGSTDDSIKIIEKTLKDCPFPCELVVRPNKGLVPTINEGLEMAHGEFFAVIASDDIWLPDFLKYRVSQLQKRPEAVLAYGHCYIIDDENNIVASTKDWYKYDDGNVRNMLLTRYPPSPPTVVYRKSALNIHKWNPKFFVEDYEISLRLSTLGDFAFEPTILSAKRVHKNNMSNNTLALQQGVSAAMESNAELLRITKDEQKLIRDNIRWSSIEPFLLSGNRVQAFKQAMLCINSNHSLSDKTKMFLKLFLPYSFIKFRRKEVYSKGKHKNIKELLKNGFD